MHIHTAAHDRAEYGIDTMVRAVNLLRELFLQEHQGTWPETKESWKLQELCHRVIALELEIKQWAGAA